MNKPSVYKTSNYISQIIFTFSNSLENYAKYIYFYYKVVYPPLKSHGSGQIKIIITIKLAFLLKNKNYLKSEYQFNHD